MCSIFNVGRQARTPYTQIMQTAWDLTSHFTSTPPPPPPVDACGTEGLMTLRGAPD